VGAGKAHAALVFHGDIAVAWCEYGSPEELPSIYHLKEYTAGLERLPDYRITCFFVHKGYRRKGVAAVALHGALDLISQAGGGVVEAYPQDMQGKKTSASFLYNGTRNLSSRPGSSTNDRGARTICVMRLTVPPS
jgi:GNAT superfamily N-acetyltransferase